MLTAFTGAIIGCIGCFAGALQSDLTFTAIAVTGTLVCFYIWFEHLEAFE